MPITYVGGDIIGIEGALGSTSAAISVSGIQQDDLILVVYSIGTGGRSPNPTMSGNNSGSYLAAPSPADRFFQTATTQDVFVKVFYQLQGATPDTELTFSNTEHLADAGVIIYKVYRGVNKTTPFDVTPTVDGQINTGLPNPPAITPVTSGARIIIVAANGAIDSSVAFTFTGLIDALEASVADNIDTRLFVGDREWTSGSYDQGVTTTGNNSLGSSWVAAALALRPITEASATLTVTLANVALDSSVDVPPAALLEVTLDNAALASAVQAGAGVIGVGSTAANLSIVLDNATLDATASLDVIGVLTVTLDSVGLATVATAGSTGSFPIRPVLIFT